MYLKEAKEMLYNSSTSFDIYMMEKFGKERKYEGSYEEAFDMMCEKLDNSISKDELIEDIGFAINATDSTDDYSIGLCNGMIYVKALLTDENPDYKKCQNNEEEKTYELGLVVGTKREREYWKNKIREKIEEIKSRMNDDCIALHEFQREAKIEVLQDLLKEE